MPSFPRNKKMQSVINDIIGKPENMLKTRATYKERELQRRLTYDVSRMMK